MDDNLYMKVQCPNDGKKCLIDGGDVENLVILLGDDEQNMQCLYCGYASNKNYKKHLDDNDFPDEFVEVCKNINERWWIPAVFTTDNYTVTPNTKDEKLIWLIKTNNATEAVEVEVPHFSDAYKMVEKLETNLGEIQQ